MTVKTVLSVIIPTYNESRNVPILIGRLLKTLRSIPHEIIIVDDNSPDGTSDIAEEIASKHDQIRVMRRFTDRGLSSAVVAGMSVAKGDYLAVMDADLQHDESILPKMLRTIRNEGCDLCVGSRNADGGSYGEWSHSRRFISWTATALTKTALRVEIGDPMSGYFMMTRALFLKSAGRINPRGFKILLEFIGRNDNLKIREIGYTFQNRIHGETKLSASIVKNFLIALVDLKFGRYISPTFFLYAFVGSCGVAVNMAGFAIGEGLGFPHINTGVLGELDPVYLSVPFGIQLSVISNYIMNNYLTFYEYRHRGLGLLTGFTLFQAVSLIGLVVQTGVFLLMQNAGVIPLPDDPLGKYLSNAAGIIVATIGNYYLNLNFTWSAKR
jgi:dolichol-phosphate mannosyltransferase